VDIVELGAEAYGAPVYVHHEIVHNTYVVEQLRRRGAISWKPSKKCRMARCWFLAPTAFRDRAREAKSRALESD